ncbi:unnamed protein product [Strongylus vulgaris]|uniref:Uncharacterized protein n=1 Tax=Strongylus vulgaris TaxID=40348 RepID=A0A3P7I1L2_STRVU|nr:unnamed protein product [Strongylus vulgaris]
MLQLWDPHLRANAYSPRPLVRGTQRDPILWSQETWKNVAAFDAEIARTYLNVVINGCSLRFQLDTCK